MLNFQSIAGKLFVWIKCEYLAWLRSVKYFVVNTKIYAFIQYFVFNVAIKFKIIEGIDLNYTQMYNVLGIQFLTIAKMKKSLKLKGTKIFNSRSERSWTFRQLTLVVKIYIRFGELIIWSDRIVFKFFFEGTAHEAHC